MDFIKTLTDIVGAPNITASPVDCLAYSRDMSIHVGIPQAVVFAKDTQQVSEILRLANSEKVPVIARGTGSSVTGAVLPTKGGVILDFTRMNAVLEINKADGYAIVEPGIICNALNAKLAPTHFFPPDPGSAPIATIGGNDSDQRQRSPSSEIRHHQRLRESSHRGACGRSRHRDGGHRAQEFFCRV